MKSVSQKTNAASWKYAKPFVKWAGGKSQLLTILRNKYPAADDKISKYCEPFVGGGAVFFDIVQHVRFSEILLNDANVELINAYIVIRDQIESLIDYLLDLQNAYWDKSDVERARLFYERRSNFNKMSKSKLSKTNIERAAHFIFLNKTCFNGLYRVNANGLFNVPIGSYKRPLICDADNLRAVHDTLQSVEIACGDFISCEQFIDANTMVYFDPPYRPLSKTANFSAYNECGFSDAEQIRLGKFFVRLCNKGAKVVLSNSDPKNTNSEDDFFDTLYQNHFIERIEAKRSINSNAAKRGTISEILVSNY